MLLGLAPLFYKPNGLLGNLITLPPEILAFHKILRVRIDYQYKKKHYFLKKRVKVIQDNKSTNIPNSLLVASFPPLLYGGHTFFQFNIDQKNSSFILPINRLYLITFIFPYNWV